MKQKFETALFRLKDINKPAVEMHLQKLADQYPSFASVVERAYANDKE